MPPTLPKDGEYSEKLDAYWNASNECWTCAVCLGVLGSIGCCKHGWKKQEEEHKAKQREKRARSPKQPRAVWRPPDYGGPFEVRGVDEERRRYFFIGGPYERYSDACWCADLAHEEGGYLTIVWNAGEKRATSYACRGAKEKRDERERT